MTLAPVPVPWQELATGARLLLVLSRALRRLPEALAVLRRRLETREAAVLGLPARVMVAHWRDARRAAVLARCV